MPYCHKIEQNVTIKNGECSFDKSEEKGCRYKNSAGCLLNS